MTDGAANVPEELARELGITVVPLTLRFGDEVLPAGADQYGFYQRLKAGEVASTSAPSVGDWLDGFRASGADEVVCVTLASGLSATHHDAVLAAERFEGRVEVVDSGSASMAEGFVAIEAARTVRDGADLPEAGKRAREVADRTRLMGAIETFEYLRRTGRVTKLQAYAATALSIRPVFRLAAGEIDPIGRPRTRSKALDMIAGEVLADTDGRPVHVAALHVLAEADARALLDRVRDRAEVAEEFLVPATPVIGANAGPGLVGLAWWSEPK